MHVKRLLLPVAVVLTGSFLFSVFHPQSVLAFFPTIWKTLNGALGTSHVAITNSAIASFDGTFFGLPNDSSGDPILTSTMKQARDAIADADAAVDDDQHTANKHFDGESFAAGQGRLITLRQNVVASLNNNDANGARQSLGQALHTLQDFYSHSNWVELGNATINSSLGNGATVGAVAGDSSDPTANTTPTCQDCTFSLLSACANFSNCSNNLVTNLITTGYYSGEDVTKPKLSVGKKCSHGGLFDGSTFGLTGGINKDSFDCDFSPHYPLHQAAVNLAIQATGQFLSYIQQDLGADGHDKMSLLLGGGPTLVFVMDTTGSMSDIQGQVTQQAVQIVRNLLAQGTPPSKFVLAPFNDPSTGPVVVTTDSNTFIDAVSSLPASGGGDCPELSMTGILQGIAAADNGAQVFMFTDASSKDAALAPLVSSLAIAKNIQIYPFTFVDGCSTGDDPTYSQIASDSNGLFFFLDRSEAGSIASLASLIVNSNLANILSVNSHLSSKSFSVPVDSTMSRVTFVVSGPSGSIASSGVTITRPDGTVTKSSDSGVSMVSLSTGVFWSVTKPKPGVWTVALNGSGNFSLSVSAQSSLSLTSFRFLQPGGRPGHEGYFPITGNPIAGQSVVVGSVIEGTSNPPQFQLRGLDGGLLQSVSLTGAGKTFPPGDIPKGAFFGNVVLPNTPFLAYVTGTDAAGNAFQRSVSGKSLPQTVQITPPVSANLSPGLTTSYTFQILNLGSSDSFTVVASDDKQFLKGFSPAGTTIFEPGFPNSAVLGYSTPLVLSAGQAGSVTLTAQPGASVSPGTTDTITLTVTSTTTGLSNYAVLAGTVTTVGEPVLIGKALGHGSGTSAGSFYVDFSLGNTGKGTAGETLLTQITTRTLSGTGTVSYVSPAIPVSVGNIAVGASITTRLFFNVPSTVSRFSFAVNGTTYDPFGVSSQFSGSASVIP